MGFGFPIVFLTSPSIALPSCFSAPATLPSLLVPEGNNTGKYTGVKDILQEELCLHYPSLNPPFPQVCRRSHKDLGNFSTTRKKTDADL